MDVTFEVLAVLSTQQAQTQVYQVVPRRGTRLSVVGNPVLRVPRHIYPSQLMTGQLFFTHVVYDVAGNCLVALSLTLCSD